jgi:hypothetical protein
MPRFYSNERSVAMTFVTLPHRQEEGQVAQVMRGEWYTFFSKSGAEMPTNHIIGGVVGFEGAIAGT